MNHTYKAFLLVSFVLILASSSFGADVTWYLNDVTFNDGASASGSFDWDADTQTLSNWNITATAGTLSAFTYTPADSSGGNYFQVSGYENEFLFTVNGSTRQLRMTPVSALTDAGGTVAINLNTWGNGSGAVECFNCAPYRPIVSGSFETASQAPEEIESTLGDGAPVEASEAADAAPDDATNHSRRASLPQPGSQPWRPPPAAWKWRCKRLKAGRKRRSHRTERPGRTEHPRPFSPRRARLPCARGAADWRPRNLEMAPQALDGIGSGRKIL